MVVGNQMHNYEKKIARLRREGKVPVEKGRLYDAKVAHDDWCLIYSGGECNCDPDISFVEITNQNQDQLARQIFEDSKKFKEDIKKKMV